jgi:hypothetical protein
MKYRKSVVVLVAVVLLTLAWRAYGWPGWVALLTALILWALLHVTRLLRVLGRAARRPVGAVDSAVMLHAKLHVGVPLLHVLALTRALGVSLTAQGEEPQVLRWTDAGGAHLNCEFRQGRLVAWQLVRPAAGEVN